MILQPPGVPAAMKGRGRVIAFSQLDIRKLFSNLNPYGRIEMPSRRRWNVMWGVII
jgi:hypothetical protein